MPGGRRLNRKQRKELARQMKSDNPGLEMVHPDAAGIDVGNESHYVAVAPHRDPEPVREFGCFTQDLRRLADWLKSRSVRTVAMQSTGVYWIPLYDMLEEYGIEVFLVNAKHTRNLPGRKTDVQESQWLLKLHSYGLLNNSFRPSTEIRKLRTYWRLRAEHVRGASSAIQRMQKTLTQMNVQLANVISDISGVSGMAILRAILAGERDREQLASLCDSRIQATAEQVAKSLEGNWREELLFSLEQEIKNYDHYQAQMAACDEQLRAQLGNFATQENTNPKAAGEPSPAKRRSKRSKASKARRAMRRQALTWQGVEADHGSGSDADRWSGCNDGADGNQRGGLGHEPVENGRALRVVAGAVSGQPSERREGVAQRNAQSRATTGDGFA